MSRVSAFKRAHPLPLTLGLTPLPEALASSTPQPKLKLVCIFSNNDSSRYDILVLDDGRNWKALCQKWRIELALLPSSSLSQFLEREHATLVEVVNSYGW